MINFIRAWFHFSIAPIYLGGGGGSSSTSSTTNNTDARLVNSGGVGVTNSIGTTVNALDGGAIQSALDVVNSSNSANTVNYRTLMDTTNGALSGIFALAKDTIQAGAQIKLQRQPPLPRPNRF